MTYADVGLRRIPLGAVLKTDQLGVVGRAGIKKPVKGHCSDPGNNGGIWDKGHGHREGESIH